jgi:hypothetical protein
MCLRSLCLGNGWSCVAVSTSGRLTPPVSLTKGTYMHVKRDAGMAERKTFLRLPGIEEPSSSQHVKVKVKVTLWPAMRAQSGGRVWLYSLFKLGATEGGGGQRHAPAALTAGRRRGTHCTGGWVGPTVGLDGCWKSRPHWDSIFGQSIL